MTPPNHDGAVRDGYLLIYLGQRGEDEDSSFANKPTMVLTPLVGLGSCGISVCTHPTICGAWMEILQPVAVDSILDLECELDCLWEPEMAKGP